MQYAKAHPGEISYATIGAGSAQEILARQIEKLAGIPMNRIPFRSGPQVMQDLIAGRVALYVSPTIGVVPQYADKQLKILASQPRAAQGPGRCADAQGEGHRLRALRLARHLRRRGTPQPIIDLLNRHIVVDRGTPEYRAMIEKGARRRSPRRPRELGQVIAQTVDDVAATIREFGMQQEQ